MTMTTALDDGDATIRSYVTRPRRYVDRRIASPLRIGQPWKATS
jgi:hypothetical protein